MPTDGDDLDPRLISVTPDGRFEFRRVRFDALVVRFHAPLDTILRELDAEYIRSAWASARSVLEAHHIDPTRFAWGQGHTSELRTFGHHHGVRPILETSGWVATKTESDQFELVGLYPFELTPAWATVTTDLEACNPPLCLAYDYYRAQRITRPGGEPIANDDGDTILETERVASAWGPVDWVLFDPKKRHSGRDAPSDDLSAPWMRLGQAMYERDHVAVLAAMDAVRSEYSEHGARICLESAMAWLMIRSNDPND